MIGLKVIPTAKAVVVINKLVCEEAGNTHLCYDIGKIESAIHSAFYPGSYPFAAGGAANVAGALCFNLVQCHAFMDGNKRTGALVAATFLENLGWGLRYPIDEEKDINAFAEIIENVAAGKCGKEELMNWFDNHKFKLEEV